MRSGKRESTTAFSPNPEFHSGCYDNRVLYWSKAPRKHQPPIHINEYHPKPSIGCRRSTMPKDEFEIPRPQNRVGILCSSPSRLVSQTLLVPKGGKTHFDLMSHTVILCSLILRVVSVLNGPSSLFSTVLFIQQLSTQCFFCPRGLYDRRCYDDDLSHIRQKQLLFKHIQARLNRGKTGESCMGDGWNANSLSTGTRPRRPPT